MRRRENGPPDDSSNEQRYSETDMRDSLARLGLIILWCLGLGGLVKFSESASLAIMLKLLFFFLLAIGPPVWMLAVWWCKRSHGSTSGDAL